MPAKTKTFRPTVALVRGPIVFSNGAFNNEATPAIGLAYIAGFLNGKGYKTTLVDAIGEGLNKIYSLSEFPGFSAQGLRNAEIIERIPKETKIIGISGMFSGEWPVVKNLISEIKKHFPDAVTVAGGEHATALPEFCLRDCPDLDFIVKGEGESTFYELIESLGNEGDPAEIWGVCFLDGECRFHGDEGVPRIRDLKTLSWPAWPEGYLEKFWALGKSHGALTERDMPMLVSRGCPYRCTFCSSPQMWTTRYILREVEDVVREIEHYIAAYDITSIQLYDLTAVTKKKWIVDFCRQLIGRGLEINWSLPAGTRSEALDGETLRLMKMAGCHYLVYAPESGSSETLENVKKRISLRQVNASMMSARGEGIILRANLIIGFPHESRLNIFKTLLYGLYLSLRGIDEVAVFLFSAYPGSEIFGELMENKQVELGDEYFMSLTSLNGKFTSVFPKIYNEYCFSLELALYRSLFMTLNYVVGYLCYPKRIYRTFVNITRGKQADTVLEHRLHDFITRSSGKSNADTIF